VIQDAAHQELRRADRWRVIALGLGVLLLGSLLVALVSRSPWAGIAIVVLSIPFTYAAVWGTALRIDMTGEKAASDVADKVVRELSRSVRIDSSKEGRVRISFPVDQQAAVPQYHNIQVDWRGEADEVRIDAESPWRGFLSRTLLRRRADAWRQVVDRFASNGFAPRP
jgi:hypothetical protein